MTPATTPSPSMTPSGATRFIDTEQSVPSTDAARQGQAPAKASLRRLLKPAAAVCGLMLGAGLWVTHVSPRPIARPNDAPPAMSVTPSSTARLSGASEATPMSWATPSSEPPLPAAMANTNAALQDALSLLAQSETSPVTASDKPVQATGASTTASDLPAVPPADRAAVPPEHAPNASAPAIGRPRTPKPALIPERIEGDGPEVAPDVLERAKISGQWPQP